MIGSDWTVDRLQAFPDTATSLPALPPLRGWHDAEAVYAVAEASTWPVGLYRDQELLYLLVREQARGEVAWSLYVIDPKEDALVGRIGLPTAAAHASLLPGEKHWILEESSSFSDDVFRQPTGLVLLDVGAIRDGGPLTCE